MKTVEHNSKITKVVRQLSVAAVIAGTALFPRVASAGILDKARAVVQQVSGHIQAKVEGIQEKVEGVDGEALEQLMEIVTGMFEHLKQTQAGYKEFVGADRCGPSSPCGAFRAQLRKMIESFIQLPRELPFLENIPPAVQQLEKIAALVNHMPPPILFASEKLFGNMFGEIQYRLEMVRYAAAQIPRLPTMSQLSQASAFSGSPARNRNANEDPKDFPYCSALLDTGKPHIELLAKSLEHLGDFVWDVADLMEDSKTVGANVTVVAGAGATTSVKNPVKATTQVIGLVIKTVRQVVELKVAATASICALKGYKAA
jgi:hypothetical protein